MIRQQLLKSKTCVWNKYTLGELCEEYGGIIQTGPFGSQLHQHDYVEKGTPVLMPKDIVDYQINLKSVARISDDNVQRLVRHKLNVGDLLVPRRGEVSKNVLISEKESGFICGTGCLKITLPNVIFPSFFKYYLRTSYMIDWLESNAVGATMLNLSSAILYKLPVILPPYEIQQKIGAILSAYDDLIENNLTRIKLLEEIAQITYEEWFVRLKFPGHETTPVDSETGLPAGWEKSTLGKCCTLVMGQSPKSEFYNFEKEGLPFHQGVKDYGHRFPENTCWSTDGSRIAKAKDILFSVRAPVGRLNLAIEDIILGRGLSAIRHKNGSQSFLFYQLKKVFFQENMLGGGAIFASVTKEDMLRVELLKPDRQTETKFNQFAAAIDLSIENLYRQNQLLKEARDILLPRLMTGMIDVEQLVLPESLGELSLNLTQEPQAA